MVRLNRIYTRTGDDGTTGLVDGSRAPKHDPRLAAVGDVDEANSQLGVALTADMPVHARAMLGRVQNELFDLGADLATPGEDFTPGDMALRVTWLQVERLEREIDTMNEELAPLRSFILPGGTAAAAQVMLATADRSARRGRGAEPGGARLPQSPVRLSVRDGADAERGHRDTVAAGGDPLNRRTGETISAEAG